MFALTFFIIFALGLLFYLLSKWRAISVADGDLSRLHSRPAYHALFSFLSVVMFGWGSLLLLTVVWGLLNTQHLLEMITTLEPNIKPIATELILSDAISISKSEVASTTDVVRVAVAGKYQELHQLKIWGTLIGSVLTALSAGLLSYSAVSLSWRARNRSEALLRGLLWASAAIAVLTTIAIVFSLIFETVSFFSSINWRIDKFLFGTKWSPLSGVSDGVLDPNKVGALPLFLGTLMITCIAMLVAVPIGLFAAIYLSDFASKKTRNWVKPMLEILAGIPTVVYGFFAAITVAPILRSAGDTIGLSIASESAVSAGLVMGIMIIPFISSLSDDVINAVPQSLRDASYGLGATKAETIRQVVLPAALPGIISAILLGVSRAVGETMIVVMAAGQGANLTLNPFEAVTTVTVQIVMLITGDTEASTAAGPAFTLGFTLFCVTLALNIFALRVVRKYRELYD